MRDNKIPNEVTVGPDALNQARAFLAAGRQPPLGEKLGIALIGADYGHAAFEATPHGSPYNPMGSLHGGYISTILDSARGIAAHIALKPGYGYTTLELKISFLHSLNDASGSIKATGRLLSMGAHAAFTEATLRTAGLRTSAFITRLTPRLFAIRLNRFSTIDLQEV